MCIPLCVPNDEVVVIEQFSKFTRVAEPGLNFFVPCICEFPAGSLNTRINQLDIALETKTKDNVFVNIGISVQYEVMRTEIYNAFYKLQNPRSQITSFVFDCVRSTVPKILLDDVFDSKDEIAQAVKNDLKASMTAFGFNILTALVTDLSPNAQVKASMNEINAAQRVRVAASDKAEAEKILVVKAAEAEAESKYLAGVGIARQRQAIIAGLQDSVTNFTGKVEDVSPKDVLHLMILTQYFDAMVCCFSCLISLVLFLCFHS